jgi:hypothetical protein
MAVYYQHYCKVEGCGQRLVNHEQTKTYVHANMAPENQPHRPIVGSRTIDESGQEVAA